MCVTLKCTKYIMLYIFMLISQCRHMSPKHAHIKCNIIYVTHHYNVWKLICQNNGGTPNISGLGDSVKKIYRNDKMIKWNQVSPLYFTSYGQACLTGTLYDQIISPVRPYFTFFSMSFYIYLVHCMKKIFSNSSFCNHIVFSLRCHTHVLVFIYPCT